MPGKRSARRLTTLAITLLALSAPVAPPGAQAAPTTERVSVGAGGTQGTGPSASPEMSGDGRYVAFTSGAANLDPADTNSAPDVFVRDLVAGTTARVSTGTGGGSLAGASGEAAISADGRYVAFSTLAPDGVPGDTNNGSDVFRHDTLTGTTDLVSVSLNGGPAAGHSTAPTITADGRHVAFVSSADDVVAGDVNGAPDVFVRDMPTAVTQLVSVTSAGGQTNSNSFRPCISGDGGTVAFATNATNLGADDTNYYPDVYVRDRTAGTTVRASVDSAGTGANAMSYLEDLSADGRSVLMRSYANNLAPGDTDFDADLFVRDRTTATTEQVSLADSGGQGDSASSAGAISADGRLVAFESDSSNLVSGDTNYSPDVFLRDRVAATTVRASVAASGSQSGSPSGEPAVDRTGMRIAFTSDAALAPEDTNRLRDVYLRDLRTAVANRPPAAVFTATPNDGSAPLPVVLDASASTDPDGDALAYAWDFGDTTTGSGMQTLHSYGRPGIFTVGLAVTDSSGNADATSRNVTVTNAGTVTAVRGTVDLPGAAGGTARAAFAIGRYTLFGTSFCLGFVAYVDAPAERAALGVLLTDHLDRWGLNGATGTAAGIDVARWPWRSGPITFYVDDLGAVGAGGDRVGFTTGGTLDYLNHQGVTGGNVTVAPVP